MNQHSPDSPSARDQLRAYCLGTLSSRQRPKIERRLQDSDAWRTALEAVRGELAMLDSLPSEPPPPGLGQRAVRRVGHTTEPAGSWRPPRRRALAAAALALCALGMAFAGYLAQELHRARREGAAHATFQQWGVILKQYAAHDAAGRFPPLSPHGGWIFELERLWPEFVNDPELLGNPAAPNYRGDLARLRELLAGEPVDWAAVTDIVARHFTYTGLALNEEEAFIHLAQRFPEYRAQAEPDGPGHRIEVGGREYFPLREGIERFFITDINNPAASAMAQSEIPLLFENFAASRERVEDGALVLFMDGHTEFVSYGARFPVTPGAVEALGQSGQ